MSFEQLVRDYRESNPSDLVRKPDLGDVVRRAHRHRRRQVAGSVMSLALVVGGGTAAAQTLFDGRHPVIGPPAPILGPTDSAAPVALNLVAASGTPRFLASTHTETPVTYGVAGRDALWLVGKAADGGWQLMKIGAPDVTVAVRVAVPSEPIGVAATGRYVWVGVDGDAGPQLLQYDVDGTPLKTYPLAARPVAVHGIDKGDAWVTERVAGGVQIVRFDGDTRKQGVSSKVVGGEAGRPATTLGGGKIFVNMTVGGQSRVTALSRTTLEKLKWSLDFGSSPIRDIAFTDPLYFAASEGDHQGFWEAPVVPSTGAPATTVNVLSTLPTYKVSTTNEHAWAVSAGPDGTVLSRYDRATATIGATIRTDVPADQVTVMVADQHYVWLVAGNKISVFGPS